MKEAAQSKYLYDNINIISYTCKASRERIYEGSHDSQKGELISGNLLMWDGRK